MEHLKTLQGRSFVFNTSFSVLNSLSGLLFILSLLGYLGRFNFVWGAVAVSFFVLTTIGIVIFKGRYLHAVLCSYLLGVVLIVSGIVKLNDPLGFSFKLEEYFSDGALAYRLKWFLNNPSISLAFFKPYSMVIGVFLSIAEVLLGTFCLIRAKTSRTITAILILLIGFLFLTGHTATCNGEARFTDRNTYEASQPEYTRLKSAIGSDSTIHVVEQNTEVIVVDEVKTVQCVSDCGCFGDALKSTVGRSLTPWESFYKDIFLIFLASWVFLSRKKMVPHNRSQLGWNLLVAFLLAVPFAILFDWIWLLILVPLMPVFALWTTRFDKLSNRVYGWSALTLCLVLLVFTLVSYGFGPIKDYSPYTAGSNLRWKMTDGKSAVTTTQVGYRNTKTGSVRYYDVESERYMNDRIWENKSWRCIGMKHQIIDPGRLPSITAQFDPSIPISAITNSERKLPGFDSIMEHTVNNEETDLSLRKYILEAPNIMVVAVRDLNTANWSRIDRFKSYHKHLSNQSIPMVLLTNVSQHQINMFRNKHQWSIATFQTDDTELKVMSRSYPVFFLIKKGVIVGKYHYFNLPEWHRFNINAF
jgi:hypothetical protein